MNFTGLPAEVVTKRMGKSANASQTKRSIASSFRNWIGRLTPNGRPLAAISVISRWQWAVSPDEVSMLRRPPARDTAEASALCAAQPIDA